MRLAQLLRPLAVILVATIAGACAHNPRAQSDPYVADGVAAIRAWLNQLPRCAPSTQAADLASLPADPGATVVAVSGRLALTASPTCTQRRCDGGCCNNCAAAWVVVPAASDGPSREIAVQRSTDASPMSASARDCKLDPIRQQIPKPQVIVSGWFENEAGRQRIIRASLCVVERPPAAPAPAPPQ